LLLFPASNQQFNNTEPPEARDKSNFLTAYPPKKTGKSLDILCARGKIAYPKANKTIDKSFLRERGIYEES